MRMFLSFILSSSSMVPLISVCNCCVECGSEPNGNSSSVFSSLVWSILVFNVLGEPTISESSLNGVGANLVHC